MDYHRPVVRESTPLARPEPKPPRSLSKGQLSLEELKRREVEEIRRKERIIRDEQDAIERAEREARRVELNKTEDGRALLAQEAADEAAKEARRQAFWKELEARQKSEPERYTVKRVVEETEQHIFKNVEVVHDGNKWRARNAN